MSGYFPTPEGNERLRELYAMLGGIPDARIDLGTWRNVGNQSETDERLFSHCGTTACAVGWAGAYPPFKAQGFSCCPAPEFDNSQHWNAVEKFFGLSEEEFEHLFLARKHRSSSGRAARLEVMVRIRKLLRKRGVISAERDEELAGIEARGLLG